MLKDQIVNKILETIKKLLKTVDNMYKLANEKKYSNVEEIAKDIIVLLKEISPIAKKIKEKIPYISAPITCENLIYSLNNIIKLVKVHSERVVSKIEFELIPILKEFEYDFYFFTCVFGDEEQEKEH